MLSDSPFARQRCACFMACPPKSSMPCAGRCAGHGERQRDVCGYVHPREGQWLRAAGSDGAAGLRALLRRRRPTVSDLRGHGIRQIGAG